LKNDDYEPIEKAQPINLKVNALCERLVASGKRIAIYGPGTHTLFLFLTTRLLKANLVAIIDREKRHGGFCWGLPVLSPEQLVTLGAEIVFISVPKAQAEIMENLRKALPINVEIICPYSTESEVEAAANAVQSAIKSIGVTLDRHPPEISAKSRYGCYSEIIQILENLGYAESVKAKLSCDAKGLPLPWYTYPAIAFIRQFDLGDFSVFEWGCGNSSLFFAARCQRVRSIDISLRWVDLIRKSAPANLDIHHRLVAGFPNSIREFNDTYDIIVVDAERRFDCAREAVNYLKPNGLIIVDNADNCLETCSFLRSQGFLQIDFTGFSPVLRYRSTTSFFFKGVCRALQQPRRQDEPFYGQIRNLDYYEDEAELLKSPNTSPDP